MTLPISMTAAAKVDAARGLAALLAAVVIIDTIVVQAPGLGLLAVPFVVAAIAYKKRRLVPTVLLLLWTLLFVVIGVAFIAATGFDAGWGDLLFAYVGTPAAIALAFVLGRQLLHRKRA